MAYSIRASGWRGSAVSEIILDRPPIGADATGGRRALHLLRNYPLGAAGAAVLLLFLVLALLAPMIGRYDPMTTNAALALRPPDAAHWFGTDNMGRDVFARMVYGARISLAVGFGSMALAGLLGTALGLVSGYFGRLLDVVVQRVMEVVQTLPMLVMALLITAALGASLTNTIIAIAVPQIPAFTRVARSSTLVVREMVFVEALRSFGAHEATILFRHVLPSILGPLIVLATAEVGAAILAEAAMSFLGLGVPEPHPSWGRMLSNAAADYMTRAPWLIIIPGLAISAVVFGANLLGDALRDMRDPHGED